MKRLYILIALVGLSGCAGRVIDWAKDTVNQGTTLPDFSECPKSYVRSIALYNQFDTQAIFDALWLADPVRIAYAQQYAFGTGKSAEQQNLFARRQLAENEQFIMFYVLSLYDVPLKEEAGIWSLFLEIDGKRFAPVEIRGVELSPEYKLFFGKNYSRFKVPYVVSFNAHDIKNNASITANTKTVTLVFRSIAKEGRLVWTLDNLQKPPAAHAGGCCVIE